MLRRGISVKREYLLSASKRLVSCRLMSASLLALKLISLKPQLKAHYKLDAKLCQRQFCIYV
jgi:hypothetical protein